MREQRAPVRTNAGGASATASLAFALAPLLAALGWVYEPFGALGFGITSPLALAFGHVARHKLARREDGTRASKMATAGLVLGYIGSGWLLFIVLFALTYEGLP
jgi:hypothetical protein